MNDKKPDQRIVSILMAGFQENRGWIFNEGSLGEYDYSSLERMEILEKQSYRTTVKCPWCGREKPVRTKTEKDGTIGYYCYCKKCRPTKIDPARLRWWALRRQPFLKLFAEAMGLKGEIAEAGSSKVYKLGKRGNIYWKLITDCRLGDEQKSLVDQLDNSPRTVLVTFLQSTANLIRPFLSNTIIVLDESTEFDEQGNFVFDCLLPEGGTEMVEMGDEKAKAKRKDRVVNFEKLTHELEEHVISCYSHIQTTAEQGEADILPPPNQSDLARLTGLPKYAVSRCFKDKNMPQYLRDLYENLNSIRGIESLYRIVMRRRTGRIVPLTTLLDSHH